VGVPLNLVLGQETQKMKEISHWWNSGVPHTGQTRCTQNLQCRHHLEDIFTDERD